MLLNVIRKLWSLRREFIKYFVVGVSGLVLDVGSLYAFKEFLHLRPVTAVIINQAFLLNYVFFLNKYWAFKSRGVTRAQMVKFYTLAGINYVISVAWMYFFNEHLGVNYLLARMSNVALAVAWNFLLYRFWVFKQVPEVLESAL